MLAPEVLACTVPPKDDCSGLNAICMEGRVETQQSRSCVTLVETWMPAPTSPSMRADSGIMTQHDSQQVQACELL